MLAANDLRSILNAAEQAVAREDATAAEQLLREALALQESAEGSPRDEVAKTLNNLAVVCEMTGKLKDAEICYRRAHKIATASLPASDPFVTTSRENLEAFCKSQGLPLVPQFAPEPAPAPAPEPEPPRVAPPPPPPIRVEPAPAPPPPRVPSPTPQPSRVAMASSVHTGTRPGSRPILFVIALVAALAVAIVLARWLMPPSVAERAETISPSEPVTSAPPSEAAPTPVPDPAPPPAPAAPEPEPVAAAPTPVAPEPDPPRPPAPSVDVSVVSAQLCRSLTTTGAWRCETASGPQAPGTLHFYTRVASTRDTVVEHRWYQDDRLHQRVELRIRANPGGFRTYSRNTISAGRAGQWKVELRASDGRLLHEETFAVQ